MADRVAVVGAGLIGRAWAIVFARAGHRVAVYDPAEGVTADALEGIAAALPELGEAGLLRGEKAGDVQARIDAAATLAEAVEGAVHVQENGPETLDVKRALFAELDRLAPPQAVLASSTSGIRASRFTEELPGRARCLVAHPINPPHLVPLVEIVPAPWTEPAATARTAALMDAAGQAPITLKREIDGFVANRMQGALLGEAFRLVEDGVCDAADVDVAIADGIGLRWAFMGPFETIDLNAPGGVRDYCDRFARMYYDLAREDPKPRLMQGPGLDKVEADRRKLLPADELAARARWRDRRLADLVAAKLRAERTIGR